MKHLLSSITLLLLSTLAFGSDNNSENLTVPHTFNSGETISSSKMNENFELIKNKLNQLLQTLKLVQNGKMNIDQPGEYTVNFVNQFDSNPIITVSTNEHGWCGVKEVNTSSFKASIWEMKYSCSYSAGRTRRGAQAVGRCSCTIQLFDYDRFATEHRSGLVSMST